MLAPIDPRLFALTRIRPDGVGVEIGVHEGAFSRTILNVCRPRKLFLVDPWAYVPEPPYENSLYGGRQNNQELMNARFARVNKKFNAEIAGGKIEILRMQSSSAAEQFTDGGLDFIYIDGDHTYAAVSNDLRNYLPKLRVGGLLIGDDYSLDGWWKDGVVRAFHEVLHTERVTIEFKLGTQIGLRKLE